MLKLLQQFNYTPPHIEHYDDGVLKIERGTRYGWALTVNNQRWMTYNTLNHEQAFEFYSHYDLARGHCICTGLGFGIREQWLLTKPEVTKITVLEKNKEVIEYHQHIKSPMMKDIEVIHVDAQEYTGECDTLLFDHVEFFNKKSDIVRLVKQCATNIKHDVLWFWPLELLISGQQPTDYKVLRSILPTLPDLDKETLLLYTGMYNINQHTV